MNNNKFEKYAPSLLLANAHQLAFVENKALAPILKDVLRKDFGKKKDAYANALHEFIEKYGEQEQKPRASNPYGKVKIVWKEAGLIFYQRFENMYPIEVRRDAPCDMSLEDVFDLHPDYQNEYADYAPHPALYILMRNDLQSLNAGKAVAQGSHAANLMVHLLPETDNETYSYSRWVQDGGGCGTTIVKSGKIGEIQTIVNYAKSKNIHAGMYTDKTYPVKDGVEVYLVNLTTCGFVFCWSHVGRDLLSGFPLMP